MPLILRNLWQWGDIYREFYYLFYSKLVGSIVTFGVKCRTKSRILLNSCRILYYVWVVDVFFMYSFSEYEYHLCDKRSKNLQLANKFPIPLKHLNSYILLCCRNLQFFSISNTGQWFLVNKAATRALRILKLTSRSSRVLIIGNVFTIRIYFICIVDNWLYVSKRSLWNK